MQDQEQILTTPIPDSNEFSAITLDSLIDPDLDDLYAEAVKFVTESREVSISALQRRLQIGYNRFYTIIEAMEAEGIVSCTEPYGRRIVLAQAPVLS